jgi:hypothetical protein
MHRGDNAVAVRHTKVLVYMSLEVKITVALHAKLYCSAYHFCPELEGFSTAFTPVYPTTHILVVL